MAEAAYAEVAVSVEIEIVDEALVFEETEASIEVFEPVIRGPRFALIPSSVRPGEPVTVAYSDDFSERTQLQAVLLNAQGSRIMRTLFFTLPPEEGEEEIRLAVLAVPSTLRAGNATIRIEDAGEVIGDLPFVIEGRDFISEIIDLDPVNTEIRTVPDPEKTAESNQLWAILSRTGTVIYTTDVFMPPVTATRRTSFYGDRRVYRYSDGTSDTSIHAGIDYGVPTGTGVRAAARGRVVLARSRIVTGNSVVLEHLPGVYSLYYHMDTIAVTENTIVEAGALLGESGSTGLSTGPHLHWEMRAATENADPDAFLARPLIDKREIMAKIREWGMGNGE